jgi:RNA polymerase sigma-B factor
MPEFLAAYAGGDATVRYSPPEFAPELPPEPQPEARGRMPAAGHGRLREAFENGLVLDYLDLAEALAARFEARGRERADLNQVAYLGWLRRRAASTRQKATVSPPMPLPPLRGN